MVLDILFLGNHIEDDILIKAGSKLIYYCWPNEELHYQIILSSLGLRERWS